MKKISALLLSLALLLPALQAGDGNYLNVALLQLPPALLADVPLKKRQDLLVILSQQGDGDTRLDYRNGWLHYRNDNPYYSVGVTSMFYLKILPRPGDPLVFVHLPKARGATASRPRVNLTRVLRRNIPEGKWDDVTSQVIPEGLDPEAQFLPVRTANVIRYCPHAGRGGDGRTGPFWRRGPCVWELHWDGSRLQKRPPGKHARAED